MKNRRFTKTINYTLQYMLYYAYCFFYFFTLCNVEVGMYGILVLSFVNMAGALGKSQEISKAAINERILLLLR